MIVLIFMMMLAGCSTAGKTMPAGQQESPKTGTAHTEMPDTGAGTRGTPSTNTSTPGKEAAIMETQSAGTASKVTPGTENATKQGLEASKTEAVTFTSKALGKEMRMKVYLPKGYGGSKKLPVLYVMHGMRDDENTILMFTSAADKLIEAGKIKPLVIVAPYIENSFGSNTGKELSLYNVPEMGVSLNVGMYEDYIYQDVIGYVKEHYSIDPSREGQYIGGISMGGYAALHLAFKHPEAFSKVGGHSPALWFEGGPRDWLYPNEEIMKADDPVYLAAHQDLKGLNIYLDCGDEDGYGFQTSTKRLNDLLTQHGQHVQYQHAPGAHDMSYWGSQLQNYLLFYSPVNE
ncbi:alpha/beta hydrolase [Paenibacillus hexagrammi]|uniref:Esterase family protein n=1 Tax=Paenibacillus hexagrammi TaxID=2908839 RepID=A0ABY3SR88_9BACL|nr:alpha/beta hydrolase-fold protein [Paenibacillus sp. YPD9-1]UJF36509.1 esterase family protein [Paenibacillus sp. YPD9-1]